MLQNRRGRATPHGRCLFLNVKILALSLQNEFYLIDFKISLQMTTWKVIKLPLNIDLETKRVLKALPSVPTATAKLP